MSRCILHPEREAKDDAQGILVCSECFERYQAELRVFRQQRITVRPFLQQLVNTRHRLPLRREATA